MLISGCLLVAMGVYLKPMYDFGTVLTRKCRMNRYADFRDRMKPILVPVMRIIVLLAGVVGIVLAFLWH